MRIWKMMAALAVMLFFCSCAGPGNELLFDETISDKARGLLVRLLARPDNWKLNVNHLIKTGKGGQVTVRSSLKELESIGYIRSDVVRHDNGRIIEVEYIVSDHILNLLDSIEGRLPTDKLNMIESMNNYFSLSDSDKILYKIGRRTGIISHIEELHYPDVRNKIEKIIKIEKITPENIQIFLDTLMKKFI